MNLTIEDIRDSRRQSGFKGVHSATSGPNGGGKTVLWKSRKWVNGALWRGPYRRSAAEAAQDYVDFLNKSAIPQAPGLKTAGHQYDIEHTDRDPEVEAALGVLRDARAQREGKQGYVYCIGEEISDPGYVKVGYSVNPQKRVAELQTGNARKLVLLATVEGTLEDERRLHAQYAHLNVLQEWFELDKELLAEFDLVDGDMVS